MFPRVTHPSATKPEGFVRLACVRPAASVHSEPGSNSQVESCFQLSLTSNLRTSAYPQNEDRSFCSVLQLSKQQKPQNSEAFPRSSVSNLTDTSLLGRYANCQTPMRPNRPHIPSSHHIFKEQEDKIFRTTNLLVLPATVPPDVCVDLSSPLPSLPNRVSAPRPLQ